MNPNPASLKGAQAAQGIVSRESAVPASDPGLPPPEGDLVVVGRILAPWGVQGLLKVARNSQPPEIFPSGTVLYTREGPVVVERNRIHGRHLLVKFANIDDRNDAEQFRDMDLQVAEADLPKPPTGTYYEFQLVGLTAVTPSGEALGTVTEVLATGANDVYAIRNSLGEQILIPAIRDVVLEVDLEAGQMVVELPKAL